MTPVASKTPQRPDDDEDDEDKDDENDDDDHDVEDDDDDNDPRRATADPSRGWVFHCRGRGGVNPSPWDMGKKGSPTNRL